MFKLHLIISSAQVSGKAKKYAQNYYRFGIIKARNGFVPKIIRDSNNGEVIYCTTGLFRGKTKKSEFYRELEEAKKRFNIDNFSEKSITIFKELKFA